MRSTLVDQPAHVLAHRDVVPTYGELIAAGREASSAHGYDWHPFEPELARTYVAQEAAYLAQHGEDGLRTWQMADSIALFGYCDVYDYEATHA
jgi:hypothetical protein